MSWLSELIGGSAGEIINSVTEGVDKFVTTEEEKKELELKKQELKLKFKQLEMDAETRYIEDRQSAREMYEKDNSLQKVFAIVFLCGYIALSVAMVLIVFGFIFKSGPGNEISTFEASIISMVFTAMSTKVNTITDFLFGGSKQQDDSESRMAKAFTTVNQKTE